MVERMLMMKVKDSSEVEWSLIVDGETIVQSTDIIDCIEAREGHDGKITDSG